MPDIFETLRGKNPNDTVGILSAALDHYGDKIALAMSFQIGGAVLLDMIHRMGREVDVLSIDTGRLPEETYDCANQITEKYGVKIHWVFPRCDSVETLIREKGLYSFRQSVGGILFAARDSMGAAAGAEWRGRAECRPAALARRRSTAEKHLRGRWPARR